MTLKLDRDRLQAEIAALEAILRELPANDGLGRMSLEGRRRQLVQELDQLAGVAQNRAQVALYFGGEPVIGSMGVQARFSAITVNRFQDVITKVWGAEGGNLAAMGPVAGAEDAQLHITQVVHGSFGFVLEELDEQGEPLFETPLHRAAVAAIRYISTFAQEDDARFNEAVEQMDHRVFKAVKGFFADIHRGRATFRLVDRETDANFDQVAVERAWQRGEATDVEEDEVRHEGRLLGVIPIARRFEFEPDAGNQVIKGKVAEQFTHSYLERISTEQFAGRRWRARFQRQTIERLGQPTIEKFTLLELEVIPEGGG
jgi:hypothetical protein